MGQAKQRGSFEKRKAEGEARLAEAERARKQRLYDEEMALTPEERAHRKQLRSDARMLVAMAAGLGVSLP